MSRFQLIKDIPCIERICITILANRGTTDCVNLPIPVAKELYEWIDLVLPSGKNFVRATKENIGTKIVIHD